MLPFKFLSVDKKNEIECEHIFTLYCSDFCLGPQTLSSRNIVETDGGRCFGQPIHITFVALRYENLLGI